MGKKCVDLVKIALFLLLLICFVSLLDRILANGTDNHKYLFRDFYDAPADEEMWSIWGQALRAGAGILQWRIMKTGSAHSCWRRRDFQRMRFLIY